MDSLDSHDIHTLSVEGQTDSLIDPSLFNVLFIKLISLHRTSVHHRKSIFLPIGPSSSATSTCKIKGYSSSLHQENRQLTAELPESLFVPKKLTSTPGPVDIRTSPVTDLGMCFIHYSLL